MLQNQVSTTIAQQDITEFLTALAKFKSKLPAGFNLPKEERDAMLKIQNTNKTFCEDAIIQYPKVKDYLPAYINVAEIQKDLDLFKQVDVLIGEIRGLDDVLESLQVLSGNEAYIASLAIYNNLITPAKRGMPGALEAYEELSKRFKTQGKKKTPPVK